LLAFFVVFPIAIRGADTKCVFLSRQAVFAAKKHFFAIPANARLACVSRGEASMTGVVALYNFIVPRIRLKQKNFSGLRE
jgi:hypothetical protein